MQTGKRRNPSAILPAFATLAGFLLLLVLGFWQLDRAEQKTVLYERFLQKSEQAPDDLTNIISLQRSGDDVLWRKVSARGYYAVDRVFLLDNQVLNGKPGYFVFTPFQIPDSDVRVLVNRGWVPAGSYREVLPDIDTPRGGVRINGILAPPPSTGILLASVTEEKMEQGVSRMQNIDLDVLAQILDYELLPYIIQLDPVSTGGYAREWGLPGSGAERHKGYAFQWFALAATLLIIYISLYFRRGKTYE